MLALRYLSVSRPVGYQPSAILPRALERRNPPDGAIARGPGNPEPGSAERAAVRVTVKPNELRLAAMHGVDRTIHGLGAEQVAGAERGAWSDDIGGALAEFIVARVLDRYPSGCVDLGVADVGRVEVRYTARPNGKLLVRQRDRDSSPFVLVRGIPFVLDVAGWLFGWQAKADRYRYQDNGRPPCYLVPAEDLRPIEDLR